MQKLLPGYYMNLNQNPRTLLPKFFGLYCFQCNSKNVRLVVMNNLLPSYVKLHLKYDLKGSTYKRKVSEPPPEGPPPALTLPSRRRQTKLSAARIRQRTRTWTSWSSTRTAFSSRRTPTTRW